MHEYSIAYGIVESAAEYARTMGRRLVGVKIAVGELSGIDAGLLERLLRDVSERVFGLEGVSFEVVEARTRIVCGRCGREMGADEILRGLAGEAMESIHFIPELISSFAECPGCGGRDLRIASGRGVEIIGVELG